MTTIVGKSAVRTTVVGKVPRRETGGDGNERVMEVVRDGSTFYIHLHSPNELGNGWAINVPADELLAALNGASR